MKLKVVQHSKYLGYSGTDKVAQTFYKYLDRTKFDPYIIYREGVNDERKILIESLYGPSNVIPYKWVPGDCGKHPPYKPEQETLTEVLDKIKPDIFHHHHSGYHEWPLTIGGGIPRNTKVVTTNIFGYGNHAYPIDKILYICKYIQDKAMREGWNEGIVLNNPVEPRIWSCNDRRPFLKKYSLPEDAILLGRIGRPDNFDPIAFKAFRAIENRYNNVYYLVVGACKAAQDCVTKLNLRRVIFVEPIVGDYQLSEFLSAINIYAHYRHDGEINSISLQEAMAHSLPIVSHKSKIFNGHVDTLEGCGIISEIDDVRQYTEALEFFINDTHQRSAFGIKAYNKWLRTADPRYITRQLEEIYASLYR